MSRRAAELWRYLASGGAGAGVLAALTSAAHLPLWAGLVAGGLTFAGMALTLSPKPRIDDKNLKKIGATRAAVVRAALDEAEDALDRMKAATLRIENRQVKGRLRNIDKAGREVVADLQKAPESLSSVQRLLTYYIPRAAELAVGYAEMERRGSSAQRRLAISDLLVKLEDAFVHYRDQLAEETLRELDVDIRLVGQALQEDVGNAPPPGRTRRP